MASERNAPRPVRRFRRPLHGTRLALRARRVLQWAKATRYARQHNRTVPPDATVLHFFPHRPVPRATITRIVERLGLRIGFSPRPDEPAIAWDTGTWFSDKALRALPPEAINVRCLDVSKGRIDRAWEEIAGYSLAVDPLTSEGPIVVKSEYNGQHDGRVEDGPLAARRDGLVYQRFVDAVEDGHIVELRTVIVGAAVPAVFMKWRPANRWFAYSDRATIKDANEVYSEEEIRRLLGFAERIGLEYGELDVLRDRGSGLIYVLDANRTPKGPPSKMPPPEARRAADLMATAFARLIDR